MSTTTLTAPIRVNTAGVHTRPGLGRLVAVELRKMIDTRAGFWLLAAVAAITVVAVAVRAVVGDVGDHDFQSIMSIALQPAAALLPIVGVLLVTSEWSQRTGLITFTLTPVRSCVLVAKLLASVVPAVGALLLCLVLAAAATALAGGGLEGTWSYSPALLSQAAVFLVTSMVIGVAFAPRCSPRRRRSSSTTHCRPPGLRWPHSRSSRTSLRGLTPPSTGCPKRS
jgi:hypothetical protein